MNSELLTEEEVREYIESELDYLNLDETMFNQYVKFIMKIDRFRKCNIKTKIYNVNGAFAFFEEKFSQLYDLFLKEGYDKETSLELTKNAILRSDRKNFITDLNLMRMLGFEEKMIKERFFLYNRHPEKVHAKKCFFIEIKYQDADKGIIADLFKISDKDFEKKFQTNIVQLLKKYPLTEETKDVWKILANLTDVELYNEYHLTREEMADIYPTTKEELKVLVFIAKLDDEKILSKYGITRKELLEKRPLNKSTLTALKTILLTSEKTIQNAFHQSKDEVLHLRTITVEMINDANQKIRMQRAKPCSKEELMQMFIQKKKGTNPNG